MARRSTGDTVSGDPAIRPHGPAATFNVTSLADSGPNTPRQAIEDANGLAGADTVTLASTLRITESVTINGPGTGATIFLLVTAIR
ncbi:MAG: hypothetical protein IPG66_02330 [Hydrogenophilales bacterium]|nr:hypothetical protein [Hydrogenophilales bacterium]